MNSSMLSVTFHQKVTRDQLIAALDRILKQSGCPNCGLNGFGGLILKGDPIERFRTEIGGIKEGVLHVGEVQLDGFRGGM